MEDKEQKLRYSRQLATYGREMQERIMDLKFFIYGSRGLGAEIAKHLVMNGVKQVHIWDPYPAELRDLSANYFMDQSLIGQKSQDESKESLEQRWVKADENIYNLLILWKDIIHYVFN